MKKDYTNKEYSDYVNAKMPKSPIWVNLIWAFAVGGLICVGGQCLNGAFEGMGFDEKTAAAWTSITLIFSSALLTGLGIYDKVAKFAGAGTLVPITGFANAVVSSSIEFKKEGIITGLGAKIFVIAGPVIVFGTVSSVVVGLLYFLFAKSM